MRVEKDISVAASREEIWELVSEPDNYSSFWHGLTRLDRKNEEHGCGARFAMRMRVGSADIGGLIEIVEFDDARRHGVAQHHRHRPPRPLAPA